VTLRQSEATSNQTRKKRKGQMREG
jgi:hypothetical protein